MRNRHAFLVLALLMAACGREPAAPPVATGGSAASAAAEPERRWQGVFPCSDCQGIDTRLLLRRDGERPSYRLSETYLDGGSEPEFDEAGTWTESEVASVFGGTQSIIVLDSGRATRRFRLDAGGDLELLDDRGEPLPDGAAHRLQRQ